MSFKYELHQHTTPCSKCGVADPELLVRAMKAEGFAGVVLTDHFYHGNTGIDRALPWKEFCDPYVETFRIAKEVGDAIDFDVLFGIEEGVGEAKEVLLYGITTDFIYDHPELRDGGLPMIYALTREAGALVIQAHPFRDRAYIPNPMARLYPQFLDGYEVWNSGSKFEDNQKGYDEFANGNRIVTVGSDCHCEHQNVRSFIECGHRITSPEALVQLLKSGEYKLRKDVSAPGAIFD